MMYDIVLLRYYINIILTLNGITVCYSRFKSYVFQPNYLQHVLVVHLATSNDNDEVMN